jgi:integrase
MSVQHLDWWGMNVLPGSVKESTVDDSRYIIATYVTPHVGRHRLAKLTPEHVLAMMRALEEAGYSSRTRQYARAVLRRALRWAEQTGLVARNAAALVDGPKKSCTKLDDTLTAAEARAVLNATTGNRLGALAVLVLSLGLRKGEALALRWPDIDLDAGELIVRGTLKRRKGRRALPRHAQDGGRLADATRRRRCCSTRACRSKWSQRSWAMPGWPSQPTCTPR